MIFLLYKISVENYIKPILCPWFKLNLLMYYFFIC